MASLKAEKPAGTQAPVGQQVKKESGTTPKAPVSKAAPKKAEPKPREPKKRVTLLIHLIYALTNLFLYHTWNFVICAYIFPFCDVFLDNWKQACSQELSRMRMNGVRHTWRA